MYTVYTYKTGFWACCYQAVRIKTKTTPEVDLYRFLTRPYLSWSNMISNTKNKKQKQAQRLGLEY